MQHRRGPLARHARRHDHHRGHAQNVERQHLHHTRQQEDQARYPAQPEETAQTERTERHRHHRAHAATGLRQPQRQHPRAQVEALGPDRHIDGIEQDLSPLHREQLHPELEFPEDLPRNGMHPVKQEDRDDHVATVLGRQRPAQAGIQQQDDAQPLELVHRENRPRQRQQRPANPHPQRQQTAVQTWQPEGPRFGMLFALRLGTQEDQEREQGDQDHANQRVLIRPETLHIGQRPYDEEGNTGPQHTFM